MREHASVSQEMCCYEGEQKLCGEDRQLKHGPTCRNDAHSVADMRAKPSGCSSVREHASLQCCLCECELTSFEANRQVKHGPKHSNEEQLVPDAEPDPQEGDSVAYHQPDSCANSEDSDQDNEETIVSTGVDIICLANHRMPLCPGSCSIQHSNSQQD